MIQILTYSGDEADLGGDTIVVNSLHDARSLDEFEINIVDLSSEYFWFNKKNDQASINSIDDLKSLSVMIANSCSSKIIIMLPQNEIFEYYYSHGKYQNKCELKNMIPNMKNCILSELYAPIEALSIAYENTSTSVGKEFATAAFYFNNVTDNVLTRSVKSNKATTIKLDGIIISALKLKNNEGVIAFLRTIGLIQDKQESPDWMEEISMFDDEKQIDIITHNRTKIQEAESNIEEAKRIIDKNNEYKSILYTNGDRLVTVVLEILERMLGCDFSEFEDLKNEDFLATVNGLIFIGEIKGVNHNVKSENIAQLDRHYQGYLDNNPNADEEKICALLIINHQKNKPVSGREVVHERQIALAKRNGSLIIETYTLLRLFEKYLSHEKTREECIDMLRNHTGLLDL